MHFVPMDPELIKKAIKGFNDELEPARTKLDAFYRQCRCPNCEGECDKEDAPIGHVFSDEELVQRSVLRCKQCSLLFDPHSGLILERAGHMTVDL